MEFMSLTEKHITYIWENYSPQHIFSPIPPQYSHTEAEKIGDQILVNFLPRFSEVFLNRNYEQTDNEFFDNLSNQEEEADSPATLSKTIYELKDTILNAVFHYLAQLDLLFGHCQVRIYKDLLIYEILKGRYGNQLGKKFMELNEKDRNTVSTFLKKHHHNNGQRDFFNDIFFDFFGRTDNIYNENFPKNYTCHSAEIYYRHTTDTFYYYCAAEETDYNKKRFYVAKSLFADCTKNICPIWGKYCFGVIDNQIHLRASTPVIDGIQII